MDLEMVLNELSLKTPAADEQTAQQLMSELISTVRQATITGVRRVLRTADDINNIELAPGYPVARWRNDKAVDREERRFFRTLTTKAPFWTDVAEAIKSDFNLSDVFHQGEEARGLCFALVGDVLPVSLNSDTRWDCSRLRLAVIRFEDEELIDEYLEIVHASRRNHVQEHTDWIKHRIQIIVSDGIELWNCRKELFPSLEFCDQVHQQLQSLKSGNPMLQQVRKRLDELENYCKTWTNGAFSSDSLRNATPESESRLNRLKQKLTFRCPDGKERIFSLHMRLTPGAWRLHFSEKLGPGKIIIGYIGPKIQST
ncbi:MAG: hypothetical protein F6K31_01695 [Symploca sp. SIO2G7]|nr:hypothetical protein [Symploca sp. SIO2G7]